MIILQVQHIDETHVNFTVPSKYYIVKMFEPVI